MYDQLDVPRRDDRLNRFPREAQEELTSGPADRSAVKPRAAIEPCRPPAGGAPVTDLVDDGGGKRRRRLLAAHSGASTPPLLASALGTRNHLVRPRVVEDLVTVREAVARASVHTTMHSILPQTGHPQAHGVLHPVEAEVDALDAQAFGGGDESPLVA